MTICEDADLVLAHFDACGLRPVTGRRGPGHMGAVITDAALQRRTKYEQVVAPRVRALVEAWPDAVTVSAFSARVTAAETTDQPLATVIRWRRPAKLRVLADMTAVMVALQIDTVEDLRRSLTNPDLRAETVRRLRQISGVGPKTVDYLGILAGATDAVAVDTHLFRFAADAGVHNLAYRYVSRVYHLAAARRSCEPGAIDAAVWAFMRDRSRPKPSPRRR